MSRQIFIALLMLLVSTPVLAETILMARTNQPFDVVLEAAKKSLEGHGYTVSHEQRCDGGLKGLGYATDYYRVLFYGKPDEVRQLTRNYPELVPYLPLKLAVVAEEGDVLAVSFNPETFSLFLPQEELKTQFSRWRSDLDSILKQLRKLDQHRVNKP